MGNASRDGLLLAPLGEQPSDIVPVDGEPAMEGERPADLEISRRDTAGENS